jgi:YVTN family beta-propeller protein
VVVIKAASRTTRFVNAGQIPCAIAVDSSSGKVFVANYASHSVTVLDDASNTVLATVDVNSWPQAIAIDPGNHRVYVASTHDGTTAVLDATTNSLLSTLKTDNSPFAIAVNPKSHTAVLLGLGGDLIAIDGTTLAVSSP